MFRPELAVAEVIDGIRTQNISEPEVQAFYAAIQRLLMHADCCTTPTTPLAAEVRALSKPATVIPNGFDRHTLERARSAMRARRSDQDDGLVRIGYAGGTLTHQRDFAVASGAIAAALSENPSARLVLFRGCIDIGEFPELKKQQEQIEWRDRVPLEDLPREYARFDINVAPVEVGNRYCEAKSELKFFEAALAGVPTIASPTTPFAGAIRHAETGLLASSDKDWYRCIAELLGDRDLRRRVADQAYRDVLWLYGPERRHLLTTRVLNEFVSPVRLAADLLRCDMAMEKASTLPTIAIPEYEVLYQSSRRGHSRVSVVVPLFNNARVLEEALESFRQQTTRDIDVIVVDDQSKDTSVAVGQAWLKQQASDFNHVALLQNRRHSEVCLTLNAGVSFCDTELYIPFDPDNSLPPDYVEKCVTLLDETGAAFAQCDSGGDAIAMVRKACWIAVGGYSRAPGHGRAGPRVFAQAGGKGVMWRPRSGPCG